MVQFRQIQGRPKLKLILVRFAGQTKAQIEGLNSKGEIIMYAFELKNKKTNEHILIHGYDWKDAVKRMGEGFNVDEWVFLMSEYED